MECRHVGLTAFAREAMLDGLKVTSEVLLAMRLESQGNQFLQGNFETFFSNNGKSLFHMYLKDMVRLLVRAGGC